MFSCTGDRDRSCTRSVCDPDAQSPRQGKVQLVSEKSVDPLAQVQEQCSSLQVQRAEFLSRIESVEKRLSTIETAQNGQQKQQTELAHLSQQQNAFEQKIEKRLDELSKTTKAQTDKAVATEASSKGDVDFLSQLQTCNDKLESLSQKIQEELPQRKSAERGETPDMLEDMEKRFKQHCSDLEASFAEQLRQAMNGTTDAFKKVEASNGEQTKVADSSDVVLSDGVLDLVEIAGDKTPESSSFFTRYHLLSMKLVKDVEWTYELGESIWDTFFLVGFGEQSVMDVVGHLAISLVYFCVMFSMVYVIADGFAQDPYSPRIMNRLKFWRATQGHSITHVNNFDSSSLVSRVCSDDPALSLATNQQNLYQNILAYQAPSYLSFVETGPLVCCCCVGIYCMQLVIDVEQAVYKLLCIWNLHHHERTELLHNDEGREVILAGIHIWRCVLETLAFCFRLGFNILMLYYGGDWLVFTVSIPDLLLNTTALTFLLSVDSDIFTLGAPNVLREMIHYMEPIHMPRLCARQFLPMFFMATVLFFVGFFFYHKLDAVRNEMATTANILCGDHLDVVVAISPQIGVHWTKTQKYDPDAPMSHWADGRYYAVKSVFTDLDSHHRFSFYQQTLASVQAVASTSMTNFVKSLQTCEDSTDKNIGDKLYVLNNNESMRAYAHCSELAPFCSEPLKWGRLMRAMCQDTCNCAYPDSGLVFLGVAREGCTQIKKQEIDQETSVCGDTITGKFVNMVGNRYCTDIDVGYLSGLSAWHTALKIIAEGHRHLGNNKTLAAFASASLAEWGCAGLMNLTNKTRKKFCNARSIPYWCPQTCRCFGDNGTDNLDCPQLCGQGSQGSSPSPSPSPKFSVSPSPG